MRRLLYEKTTFMIFLGMKSTEDISRKKIESKMRANNILTSSSKKSKKNPYQILQPSLQEKKILISLNPSTA